MSLVYYPKISMPKDINDQLGQFEKEICEQNDAVLTNFVEPFGKTESTERLNSKDNAYWIVSRNLGKAFKVCKAKRTVIEHETDNH